MAGTSWPWCAALGRKQYQQQMHWKMSLMCTGELCFATASLSTVVLLLLAVATCQRWLIVRVLLRAGVPAASVACSAGCANMGISCAGCECIQPCSGVCQDYPAPSCSALHCMAVRWTSAMQAVHSAAASAQLRNLPACTLTNASCLFRATPPNMSREHQHNSCQPLHH